MQLDNLPEHCTLLYQEEARRLGIRLVYLPSHSTDVGAVIDYDLGRIDKNIIREQYAVDFVKRPAFYVDAAKDGGIKASQFRELLVSWVKLAHSQRKPDLILKRFKNCGMYNAVDGTENHLIKVRGVPNYNIRQNPTADEIAEEQIRAFREDPDLTETDPSDEFS